MSDLIAANTAVSQVIQETYDDATQTILDHRAAHRSVHALRELGWASPEEVRALILAAGGSVSVSAKNLEDAAYMELCASDDYENFGRKFTVRPRT